MTEGSVDNGTLAESQAQAAAIWRVREGVTESLQRRGEQQQAKPHLLDVCAAAVPAAGLAANTPTALPACLPARHCPLPAYLCPCLSAAAPCLPRTLTHCLPACLPVHLPACAAAPCLPHTLTHSLPACTGATYKYDLSMPTHKMYELVQDVRQRVSHFPDVVVVGYGHVGDGNLHLNVSSPSGYNPELEETLEPYVYEWTARQGGSISAEHGIGRMKAAALQYSKSGEAVDLMQRIKLLFDPHRILNPYKVLPDARHLGEVERY